jgi:predicted neuraminidase
MKMFRVHLGVWIVLLIVGYLVGFVPEYQKNRELQAAFKEPQKTIHSLQTQVQLGELRDISSLLLVELTRQNYGLARDYSQQYDIKLKSLMDSEQDEALKKLLDELATAWSAMAPSLADANPSAVMAVQVFVSKTFEVTKRP